MLKVGNVYRANGISFNMYFAVLEESDVSWTIDIRAMKGKFDNLTKGEVHICKFSQFISQASIMNVRYEISMVDDDLLDDCIDCALDYRLETWFNKLASQKIQKGVTT